MSHCHDDTIHAVHLLNAELHHTAADPRIKHGVHYNVYQVRNFTIIGRNALLLAFQFAYNNY